MGEESKGKDWYDALDIKCFLRKHQENSGQLDQ